MDHPLTDRIQVPPQALFARDHIIGLCEPSSDEITQEVNWRIEKLTVKYVGGATPASRVVVIEYEDLDADGVAGVHEFDDMNAWLWVVLPRAEAESPNHTISEAA